MNEKPGYTVLQVAKIVNGKLLNKLNTNKRIQHLLTDSRRLIFPETTVFFAIETKKNDGHLFIKELIDKGVSCFVVSKLPAYAEKEKNVTFIIVNNALESLQKTAAFHRKQFKTPIIAITGSNGKTIIKEWLCQLLSPDHNVVKSPKSYNSQIGVPLSVWQINKSHNIGIFEAGVSKTKEMDNLQKILKPDIGIFANIGPAHDEGFNNRKEKINEKLKLFTQAGSLIYCADHKEIACEIVNWAKKYPNVRLFSWSVNPGCDMQVAKTAKSHNETYLEIIVNEQNLSVKVPFSDFASVENSIQCIALMILLNYDNQTIKKRITLLQPVAMRMELKHGINNCTLINDSYNSDVYSLGLALDFLATQHKNEKKTLILSDILQTGIEPKALYKQVSTLINEKGVHRLIGIGAEISNQSDVFNTTKSFYKSTEAFLENHDLNSIQNQAILIKGARIFGFEKIIAALQLKDHQTILEINLDAMIHNFNVFRSCLNPGVKTMVVVKAFGYGSGGYEVASLLQYHNADYLAVAYTDEGKELRKAGINAPVMVMNPEAHSFEGLFKYNLEPEIYSFKLLDNILEGCKQNSSITEQSPLKIHIKIDTGMHRLGFCPEDIAKLAGILHQKPFVKVQSVFSHFAASDEPGFDLFSKEQFTTFINICDKFENLLGYRFLRHICNSSAITRFPEAHMDMVRLGIGLYGITADKKIQSLLKNVSTFKSVISQIKTVKKGNGIGYNLMGKANTDIAIGIVPVGYADGLNRKLGNNNGTLFVKNMPAPTIGNICMDMCMINITCIDAKEGDEVIIFGENNPITELAKSLDTIPYEILTNVSARVKRVYYQE